jgi:hypothetical protein
MNLSALLCLLALAPAPAAPGFAVVELFTSEGCSSCPPADQVLADVSHGAGVYALEYHVDYWNSLGCRDPYSAAAYSDRQRAYADALGEDQVYTPQMIVNGTNAFVGSNRQRAEAAIAAGLAAQRRSRYVRGRGRSPSGAPEHACICDRRPRTQRKCPWRNAANL